MPRAAVENDIVYRSGRRVAIRRRVREDIRGLAEGMQDGEVGEGGTPHIEAALATTSGGTAAEVLQVRCLLYELGRLSNTVDFRQ